MRNIVLPLGLGLFLSAVGGGAIASLLSHGSPSKFDRERRILSDYDQPTLTSDGITVYADDTEALSIEKQEHKVHGLAGFMVEDTDHGQKLELTIGGQKIGHEAVEIDDPTWIPSEQAVVFICEDQSRRYAVWEWTKATGFHAISRPHSSLENLSVSPDGKTVSAGTTSGGFSSKSTYLLVSRESGREKTIKYNDYTTGIVPLSMDEVLVDGHEELGYQTYRWNMKKNRFATLFKDGSIVGATVLDGHVYALHKRGNDDEIVRMNEKLDGWNASYTMPRGVKRGEGGFFGRASRPRRLR